MSKTPSMRDAIRAAAAALAATPPKPITLPGIGACFKRALYVTDVVEADEIRAKRKTDGLPVDHKTNVCIGLAQTICDDQGALIFDPADPQDLALLSSIPWSAVRIVTEGDAGDAEKNV